MARNASSNSKYKIETINNAKFLHEHGYTMRQIARKMKIPKSVIGRWINMSFSVGDVRQRREAMAVRRVLTRQQESIAAGWIIYRSTQRQSTTTIKLKKFIHTAFNRDVSSSWITSFMKRRHLSLQEASTAKGSEMMEIKYEEAVKCLEEIRSLNKSPGQIAVMDKTKFYNDSHRVKHIGIKGAGRPRRRKSSRGSPLCMYSFLVADGSLGPLYLETTIKSHTLTNLQSKFGFIKYLSKKGEKRGERGYLLFLETCVDYLYLLPGDVLITDNENSFKTKKVKNFLKKHNIINIQFPSYMNHLMNPCDNYFHASMKRRYWSSIDNLKYVSIQEKVNAIRDAYYSEEESSIIKYFRNCGIVGDKKSSEVVSNLLNEGLFPTKKFHSLHIKQLDNYVKWFTNNEIDNFPEFLGSKYFVVPK